MVAEDKDMVVETGQAQTAIVPARTTRMPLVAYVEDARNAVEAVRTIQREVMRDGIDYGTIPGCGDKPTLLKPGAETLLLAFQLSAADPVIEYVPQQPEGHYEVRVRVDIVHRATGIVMGFGVGSCSTLESKYRWRHAERVCPTCGAAAIIKGKEEYGGGWFCFAKKGGCGAKFKRDDPLIASQQVGRVENLDSADSHNTILKMAKKRALVDATLTCCAASGVFTQDVEDIGAAETASLAPAPDPAAPAKVVQITKTQGKAKAAGKQAAPAVDLASEVREGEGRYRVLRIRVKRGKKTGDLFGVFTVQSTSDTATLNAFTGWDEIAVALGCPAAGLVEGAAFTPGIIAVLHITRDGTWLNLTGLVSVAGNAVTPEDVRPPELPPDEGQCLSPEVYQELPPELTAGLLYAIRREFALPDWRTTEEAFGSLVVRAFRQLKIASRNPRHLPEQQARDWIEGYGQRPPNPVLPQAGPLPFSIQDALAWVMGDWSEEIGDLGEPMDMHDNPLKTPGD